MTITTNPLRIIKKSTCPKISPKSQSQLAYECGVDSSNKEFFLRVTKNIDAGGRFSNEWVPVKSIIAVVESLSTSHFDSTPFEKLFDRKSANNKSFLVAVCRAEKILIAVNDTPMKSALGNIKGFKLEMSKLSRSKINLKDEVAAQEARRAEKTAKAKKKAASDKPVPKKTTAGKKSPTKKDPAKKSPSSKKKPVVKKKATAKISPRKTPPKK